MSKFVLLFFAGLYFTPLWAQSFVESSSQIILVDVTQIAKPQAKIYLLEKSTDKWRLLPDAYTAVIGKNGIATGVGFESDSLFKVEGQKKEGDLRSPTGIFELGTVYGVATQLPFESKLTYRQITEDLIGIDDPKSKYYNQIISTKGPSAPAEKDWLSFETLLRKDGLYKWFIEIRYNLENAPGAGSLIFLHVWRGPGAGTAACTALEEDSLLKILKWLQPSKNPRFVLLPPGKKSTFFKSLGIK